MPRIAEAGHAVEVMADGDHAEGEEQVVNQAQHRGRAERPVAEAEPQVEQDGPPAQQDGVQGPQLRLRRQLAVEVLQPLRLRIVAELGRLREDSFSAAPGGAS